LTFETLQIIFPYAAALAVVGMLESLMTATIIDDLTDTSSDKNRECKGQGIANIGAGLLGTITVIIITIFAERGCDFK
jgi:SulP family sulfate permease